MSDDPYTLIVGALEVLAAVGIAGFWIIWFRQPHDEPWLPAGYVEHEAPFVFSDTMLAIVLILGAGFQVTEQAAGRSLGLMAAGMLAFLGVLDLGYFARTGLFRPERGGTRNVAIVAGVLTLSVILAIRFV